MSDILIKGQSEPIDERIAGVLDKAFNPKPEEKPTEEPKEEAGEQPTEEEAEEEVITPETEEEADDVDEETTKKPSRAEKRIRQLNDDKKAAELKAHALELQVAEMKPYLEMLKNQVEQPVKDKPILPEEYESQEDFAIAILAKAKEQVRAEIQGEIQPLQHNLKNQQYVAQVNTWFNSHPEATDVKGVMDKLSEGFDANTRTFYENQILSGDTFILDALYLKSKPEAVDNSGLIKEAIKADQGKASVGTTKKASKSSKVVNSNSSYDKAMKGDFTDWLTESYTKMENKIK